VGAGRKKDPNQPKEGPATRPQIKEAKMTRWALFLAMLLSVPFVLPTIKVHLCSEKPFPGFGNGGRKVIVDVIRRFGIALIVFGIFSTMAAGSAHAWPRVGIAGHFSHGPAWNREPVAKQGAKIDVPENSKNVEGSYERNSRKPVETGNLPEGSQSRSYGDKRMDDGKKLDQQYIDVGP
jgi:hypothetical protein